MKNHSSNWLDHLKPATDANSHLICFPFAGGSSLNFTSWKEELPSQLALSVISLPGRGSRFTHPPLDNLHDIADQVARQLRSCISSNAVFYGHSMGAALAYEVALRLQDLHLVRHLFCGACRAPHLPLNRSFIHPLPDKEFIEALGDFGATPDDILNNTEMMETLLPMLRADFKAIETYRPSAVGKLQIPITVFAGKQDEDASPKHMQPWASYTTGAFLEYQIEAGHFFLDTHASFIFNEIVSAERQF